MAKPYYRTLGIVAGLAICAVVAGSAGGAEIIELVDHNSTARIDPWSDEGMYAWSVDGVNHMFQQWFWIRYGRMGFEMPVNDLDRDPLMRVLDTNFYEGNDTLMIQYAGATVTVELKYVLTGGELGDGTSDMAEVIKIINTSDETLDLHFFQYCDFDLGRDEEDDVCWISGGNTAVQMDTTSVMSETVVATMPDRVEVNVDAATYQALSDEYMTDLNNDAGPMKGDVTWAFQWDVVIQPGQSVLISKNKVIVPEPATLGLIAAGGLLVLCRRRRRA